MSKTIAILSSFTCQPVIWCAARVLAGRWSPVDTPSPERPGLVSWLSFLLSCLEIYSF